MGIKMSDFILSEAIKLSFLASEVAIIIAYLIIVSMYQISIQVFSSNEKNIQDKLNLFYVNKKLVMLKYFTMITSLAILLLSISLCVENTYLNIIDIFLFLLIVITFTYYIIQMIDILKNQEKG